jgi:hypothetical protein
MACPYFEPVEPSSDPRRSQDSMLPLGDCWHGVCRAAPGEPFVPAGPALRSLCNLGYARGVCARFPDRPGPDAVRFTIVHHDGDRLRLYHVVECDHLPFAHGAIECFPAAGTLEGLASQPVLARQALAYVHSYLKWKNCAPAG